LTAIKRNSLENEGTYSFEVTVIYGNEIYSKTLNFLVHVIDKETEIQSEVQ